MRVELLLAGVMLQPLLVVLLLLPMLLVHLLLPPLLAEPVPGLLRMVLKGVRSMRVLPFQVGRRAGVVSLVAEVLHRGLHGIHQ